MTLSTANSESESGFDLLTQCSVSLQTLEQSRFDPIELRLGDEVSLIGFLDPYASHTFYCGPAAASQQVNEGDITYTMGIENLTVDDAHPSEPMIDQISSTFNSLTVDSSFFAMNHKYKVTCTAKNTANTDYGLVSKLFDTEEFADPVGIGVSPARGAPYQTIFSIHVMKPTNEALKCVFGYLNNNGEVLIEDLTGAGKRYSSQN